MSINVKFTFSSLLSILYLVLHNYLWNKCIHSSLIRTFLFVKKMAVVYQFNCLLCCTGECCPQGNNVL